MERRQAPGRGRWGQLITTLVVCLLGFGNIVTGQGLPSVWNPVDTVCNMALGRGVVVGNKMYVDGGEVTDQSSYKNGTDKLSRISDTPPWQNTYLWELDLSQKFNVSKAPWTTHTKPDDWNQYYNGASGTLWNIGDGKFYTLGGKFGSMEGPPPGQRILEPYYTQNTSGYYFQLPDPRVFAFDPQTGNWSSELLPQGVHRVYDAAYTQSARNQVGYTFGGTRVKEKQFSNTEFFAQINDGDWLDSMAAYDFRTGKFNFTTMPDSVGQTKLAMMHSLDRVGNEGVLVALAGRSSKNNVVQTRPMDEILIYDIETSTWMQQNATGDIPTPRYRTCSVLVPAPDLSSFQIYLFSGMTEGDIRILDMYVLSIPAFTWTKVGMTNYPDEWPIADMACGLYEERQFIIVPGMPNVTTAATAGDNFWTECNLGTAIHVFDTYDWEFKPEFDPDNKGSKVPSTISYLVGGDDTGGATLSQPTAGWDYEALSTIFSIRNQLPPSPNLNITGSPRETTSNKSAIIGGAVGGVCAVVLIVGILIFFAKRWKASQPAELGAIRSRSELEGISSRTELPETTNRAYELYAYEPPEMGGDAVGGYVREKEAAHFIHPSSGSSTTSPSLTC